MRLPLSIVLLCLAGLGRAAAPKALFVENKGQWPQQVLYRTGLPGGALFVERDAFTYILRSGDREHQHGANDTQGHFTEEAHAHAYKVHFVGGGATSFAGGLVQPQYENHFIGNDPARWGTGCAVHGEVTLHDVWPGIDLHIDGSTGLKYEFVVAPGADASLVQLRFEGQDALSLKDGRIIVRTTAGTVVEEAPISFLRPLGTALPQDTIASRYRLQGDRVSFVLPEGYDGTRRLVIDPTLTFSSYSGSTADNFGFTATYDATGHLYGGGNVYGLGYPATTGVLDPSFNGGTVDIGLSKWSPDGAALIWSTYIGGVRNEQPHSLVVNDNDELFVLGCTGSWDFPVTSGCFDNSFSSAVGDFVGSYDFMNGSDIYVVHLNAAATAMLGSTFVGGTGVDGANTGPLSYNYGDAFRGEIALDGDQHPVVATSTSSWDMPFTPGAPQTTYGGGGSDAYFFRMDPALTVLEWGTYYGGSEADTGYGVQLDSNGQIFTTGGTQSADLPMQGPSYQPAFGGTSDGFIARYAPDGSALLSSTYLGTTNYDQSFFVQLDTQDAVYVVGQTRGTYPMTPGKYGVAGSSQFIHKLQHDLGSSLWSTRIGNGTGVEDISPSAFLVSDCGQIYFSGWGGSVNNFAQSTTSTTNGLPTTPSAYQSTTDGSDFYLMVLEPDAVALNYATFFGGATGKEHVDGGTSRFDKNGNVYQAVCAGCSGSDDFPTTPGAWSETNNSSNCNLGVFKFDLAMPVAQVGIDGPNTICFPSTVQFTNTSSGGNTYQWQFGDGGTGDVFEPTHEYTQAGTFTVSMIMTDIYGCSVADTAELEVIAVPPPVASVQTPPVLCPGASAQLQASGGDTYQWFPPAGLSATNIADPIATPAAPTTYSVVVGTFCGTDTATVDIVFGEPEAWAMDDAEVCVGGGIVLTVSGGTATAWTPTLTLNDPLSATPTASPLDTTVYHVTIITPEGCTVTDSVMITVVFSPPDPALSDTAICTGASVQLLGPVADSYAWRADAGISTFDVQNPTVTPLQSTWYLVNAINVCGSTLDSAFVDLITVQPRAWPDTMICPGSPVLLQASGGVAYAWSPATGLDAVDTATPLATVWQPTTYTVAVTDANGCQANTSVSITLWPLPVVVAGPDVTIDQGWPVQLTATGDGVLEWAPPEWLDCVVCPSPIARPEHSTTYTVTITDVRGCKSTDVLTVLLNGTLFVPNTFSPNGDGINDVFTAYGSEIDTFRMLVFNRWGEEIYRTDNMGIPWNGTYKGLASPIDTYVWRIDATELAGQRHTLYGHVNLVR